MLLLSEGSESFTLNLVSREAITNETVRVGKKFPTSQKISGFCREIFLKNYLKDDKLDTLEETQNTYGFIGNMKKPFSIITWLASKSVSGSMQNHAEDSSAGYVFYETQDGFNFMSIDKIMESRTFERDYTYKPNVIISE